MVPTTVRTSWFLATGILGLLFLSGCGLDVDYQGPKTAEVRANFEAHPGAFRTLKKMLQEDRRCANDTVSIRGDVFVVGTDQVCGFYEEETLFGFGKSRWSNVDIEAPRVEDTTTVAMLTTVGLSRNRYDRYLALLDTIQAEKATIRTRKGHPDEIKLYLGGAGWVASSYYVRAVHLKDAPEPVVDDVFEYMKREGYGTYKVYSSLGDRWYVELDMQW